jgi:hypothetical protein
MQELKRRDSVVIRIALGIIIPIFFMLIAIRAAWHDLTVLRTDAILAVSLFIFVFTLPEIIVAVSYIIEDHNKKIFIDKENQCLVVKHKGEEIRITQSDIVKSYHIESRRRGVIGYEYILLILPERKKIYITNLFSKSKDIISFFSLSCINMQYMLPRIDRTIGNAFLTTEEHEDKVDEFRSIFKNHSDDELYHILRNRKDYATYAVKAAQILLKERSKK